MRVAAVRVDIAGSRERFAELLRHIPAEKADRLHRFRQDKDFNLGLMADLLLRTLICEELGLHNRELRIVPDEHGKPQLAGREDCQFNVSHSGEWVAAVIDSQPVGIDVEWRKEVERDIAKRFFTPDEVAYLDTKTGAQRTQAFYRLWTLKESYMKADGRGMRIGLDTFGFALTESGDADGVQIELRTELPLRGCSFRLYDSCPGCELAVCAMHGRLPDEVELWDELELIRRFTACAASGADTRI